MANRTARGVRKVNETITQDGRALIITEKQADELLWNDIPVGSIRINTQNGTWSTKIEGQSDWVPGGIKNDGTINIVKDTHIAVETYVVRELEKPASPGKFSYTHEGIDGKQEKRDGIVLYKNANGMYGIYNQYGKYATWLECKKAYMIRDDSLKSMYKNQTKVGYVFALEDGDYGRTRNMLNVMIDDTLERSAQGGGIIELDETRFCLVEELEKDMKITVRYIQAFRLGNPYPRVFISKELPKTAEIGDFTLDVDDEIDDGDELPDAVDDELFINWDQIRKASKPTTLAGYGITDKVAYEGHKHLVSDIAGFPTSMPANGGHADSASKANVANNATRANSATSADTATIANKAKADGNGRNIVDTYATKAELRTAMDTVLVAQNKVPTAAENKIWFDTSAMVVRVYKGGKWRPFGASYK